jgi:DNA-3-methyladenine glycosylase II
MARNTIVTKNKKPISTSRGLSSSEIARARLALMRRDKRLGAVIKKHGRCGIGDHRTREPFAALVRTIVSQQLSTKAAATIHQRVVDLLGGHPHVTPEKLLAAELTALRAAGLSGQKVTYVRDLADRVKSGALDLHALDGHGDEEVIARITAVKGLGRWSAQMFLMFRLNRPDILPTGDLGIVKGFQRLHGMKRRPSEKAMERLAEPWRPYRSIACWYLWRLLE